MLFATALVLPPVIRLYVVYLEPIGDRHDGFERWCAARPLLLAVLCPRAGADATLSKLAATIDARRGWVNRKAGFPWQGYRVRLEAVRLSDDVMGVRVADVALVRGPRPLSSMQDVVALVAEGRSSIDELWLHGQLHDGDEAEDPEVSWIGHVDGEQKLVLRAARELPYWLVQTFGKGPPRDTRDKGKAHTGRVLGVALEG